MTAKKKQTKKETLKVSTPAELRGRTRGLFEMPSGAVLELVNPGGMRAFLKLKIIPNSLMPIMQKAMKGGKSTNDEMTAALTNDEGEFSEDNLAESLQMMNNIALAVIKNPPMMPVPTEADVKKHNKANPDDILKDIEDFRDFYGHDHLFVDELPDEDKMYIFHWAIKGTADLETFRRQYSQGMDAVATSEANEPVTT